MKQPNTITFRTLVFIFLVSICGMLTGQNTEVEMARQMEKTAKENQQRSNGADEIKGSTALDDDAKSYLIETSRAADLKRYKDVRGTPFRYKDFGPGYLYDVTLNEYYIDSLNYNGFSSQFEFYTDGQLRELNPNNFLRVEMVIPEEGRHIYGRGINPKFRDRYAEIIYKGDYITGTMVYDVKNEEKVVQDVGKTLKLRRFTPKSLHYAMVDGDFVTLKLTPKNVAEDLGFKSELLKFMKANKLKPGRQEDLVKIYAKADELYE